MKDYEHVARINEFLVLELCEDVFPAIFFEPMRVHKIVDHFIGRLDHILFAALIEDDVAPIRAACYSVQYDRASSIAADGIPRGDLDKVQLGPA